MGGSAASCQAGKVVLLVFLALVLAQSGEGKKIPRWWLRVAQRQGPNACVVEEIPGTNKEFWTECRYWLNRNICGRKTRIRFECCEGFGQIEGEDGCILVKPLRNLLETAEELGATKWAAYIRESGRQSELEGPGAYTLFVPTNDAFDEMKEPLRNQVDAYRGNPSNPILLYHLLPTKLRSEDFDGDLTVETLHQGHNIRINKYSNGMTTINCALVIRKDQEASNGIVHVIDGVLDPSLGIANNVADMILSDGRFQVMAEMLEKSGYINVLRTHQGSISILAPYDEAFQKIPESRRLKIINDREARLALLQNHVIPHVICESAITGKHRVKTMGGNKLTFNCDIDGAYVESTKLKENFNLGKNGILHMLDDVLLPDRAKNLVELAESKGLPTFVDLVKKSGLEETLSHTGDYTFFVPDESAWLDIPPQYMEKARRDPEYAGLMIRYHGAYGRYLTKDITDNQAIMSLDEENPVRLQVWRRAMGVEDAKIIHSDLEAQNGVIHIITKVIFPANQTVGDILRSIPGPSFNTFLYAMDVATEHGVLNIGPGTDTFYTFFVPTDAAFMNMDEEEMYNAFNDVDRMIALVKSHVAVNMFPETSFESGLIYHIDGMHDTFKIEKEHSGQLKVNGATVVGSHMSANGVVYIINDSFMPEKDVRTSVIRTSISTVARLGENDSHQSSYGHSSSSYSSSSSSSRKTKHNLSDTVTFNEGYGKDVDSILPTYPQGTVIASSVQRTPENALPPYEDTLSNRRDKASSNRRMKTNRRRRRKNRNFFSKRLRRKYDHKIKYVGPVTQETLLKIDTGYRLSQTTTETPNLNTIDVYRRTSISNATSTNNYLTSAQHEKHVSSSHNNNYNYSPNPDSRKLFATNSVSSVSIVPGNVPPRLPPSAGSTVKSYIYKGEGWESPYQEPGYINTTHDSRKTFRNTIGNPPPSPHRINHINTVGTHGTHSLSKIYTYKYTHTFDKFGLPNPLTSAKSTGNYSTSSSIKKFNTIGPVSPEGSRRFSYIGHSYGNDVVGRQSNPLPFTAPRDTYVTLNSTSSSGVQSPTGLHIHEHDQPGVSTLTHRKVGVIHTVYSIPVKTHITKSTSSFTFPVNRKTIPSFDSQGKPRSDLVAAYDFTGGERDFADGTEFSEVVIPPEDVITAEQAKILRRQWRRKRHHQMRKNHHGRRKGKRRLRRKQKTE